MKRILVTGGSGFIGSHLVKNLLSQNHEVICVDNFFSGPRSNIVPFLANDKFEMIRHDVVEPIMIEVDQVYHLACPASPVHYQYNPIKTVKTNVVGTLNMLGLAKRVKARILLASTSEVYGDPKIHPQTEDYWGHVNPIGLRSCYDEGKRLAETLMMDYHRSNDVDIRIVRIFNTYGPNMAYDDGRVVSNFITQSLRGDPITLYGDGQQTRSFCYVDDMVEGIVRMMDNENFIGPVNLGNPKEICISELAEEIIKQTGSRSPIHRHPLPSDDPMQRCPDISLAKRELNWQPITPLQSGLEQTIDYFRNRFFQAG